MSGFNTSTRTGDMSMKLRAQNMRNARDQTKRLEEDNRKMEERLRELKTVMTREKEERERQGGGFWGRGQAQVGSLTKYADEVLSSKAERPPRENKKKKIKVLQDEPIEVPKRSAQPGTMKYIAQRKLPQGPGPVPRDKQKGPKCGQCEDRSATLSCVQCSEIYCPGCFAAFHVKGALKQHRSVPISASGPRVCMSPHPSADAQQSPRGSQASGSIVNQSSSYGEGSGASSARQSFTPQIGAAPTGPNSSAGGGSLLDGAYDESQSAASFQAALMAWREGPSSSPSTSSSPSKDGERSSRSNPSRKVVASPVKSPVIAVDESTGTPEETRVPEIKFTSSLSYAERLLLKRHRRTELVEVSTPRLDSQSPLRSGAGDQSEQMVHHPDHHWGDRSGRPVSASRSFGSFSRREPQALSSSRSDYEQREDTFIDDGERVDFQALLEAVKSAESPEQLSARGSHSAASSVSITEIKSTYPTQPPQYKTSATYVVEEAMPMDAWRIQQSQISSATFVKDSSGSAVYSSPSSSTKLAQARNTVTDMFAEEGESSSTNHSTSDSTLGTSFKSDARQRLAQRKQLQQHAQEIDLHSQLAQALQADDQPTPRSSSSIPKNQHLSGHPKSSAGPEASKTDSIEAGERKSAKSSQRPRSGMSSHPKSSIQTSRPGSRAQSRAASRMKVDGALTKAPSSALSQVAKMVQSSEHTYTYQSPLEDFFLAGVEGQPPAEVAEERVLTPSKGRKPTSASRPKSRANDGMGARDEKFKISYKLYKMAPKSWRPDSSLGDAVPLSEIKLNDPQEEMTMSYSYSGQMSGQAAEWRPSSSHSRIHDDSDVNPALVFGDEMFTEDAAAAAAAGTTPTPRGSSLGGFRPQSSGKFTPSTPRHMSRLIAGDISRQSEDGSREDDVATPTPSQSARRKSAGRRSVTPGNAGSVNDMYSGTSGANTPTIISGSFEGQRSSLSKNDLTNGSENVARRSANLRRALASSGQTNNKTASSPLPPTTMVPTPPQRVAARQNSSLAESGIAPNVTEASRSASTLSARSAQLSRRGLRSSLEKTPTPSQESSLPSDSHRLSSASAKGDRSGKSARAGHLGSSAAKSGSFPSDATDLNPLPSRAGVPRQPTSTSRPSSGLRRHVSDIDARSQPHSRPASTSHHTASSQRQQTTGQQWRPNSSTGEADPARKPEVSLRASLEGRTHLSKDTVIADVLHSRVQADGWMDGEDDDSDVDVEEEMTGLSHNYDDGNDLGLVQLISRRVTASRQRDIEDEKPNPRSSQHWETEVRPFSGGSSSRAGNSSARIAGGGDGNAGSGEKKTLRSRPSSSRPLSSLSRASGRESRAIVMDGEDLSMYDTVGAVPMEEDQDTEDRETLEKLEWELASDTGRLTADGQISRMSILENEDGVGSGSSSRSSAKSLRDYDVNSKLLEDEQHAREEVDEMDMSRSVTLDEDEVKALR